MTDRELLELAAKAAGIQLDPQFGYDEVNGVYPCDGSSSTWNPLTDDSDALRLAVKLGVEITIDHECHLVGVGFKGQCSSAVEDYIDGDPYAATRRAIVRAAAEVGKGMK